MSEQVRIWTDGACSGNPGPGGWGAIVEIGDAPRVELYGGDPDTTNNRMEMTAAIRGLESLPRETAHDVILTTDSDYLVKGITQWIHGWKRKGWISSTRKPVANRDLWERLDELNRRHRVRWQWVKGHSGHAENERADRLAVGAIDEIRSRGGVYSVGVDPEPSGAPADPAPAKGKAATTRAGGGEQLQLGLGGGGGRAAPDLGRCAPAGRTFLGALLVLPARDAAKTNAFYGDVLGLTTAVGGGFDAEGVRIVIEPLPKKGRAAKAPTTAARLRLAASSLATVRESLEDAGAPVDEIDGGVATVDPDGRPVEITGA